MRTARLTSHARARCTEMGITTKVAKRIAREAEASWPCTAPGHPPGRMFVRSPSVDGRLLLLVAPANNTIVTVLWWTDAYFDRQTYMA